MFIRAKRNGSKTYLQIVQSVRVGSSVRQHVLLSLGNLDSLRADGKLDSLLLSGLKFSQKISVLDAHADGKTTTTASKKIGAPLLFERLWKESGIASVIKEVLKNRGYIFSVERVIFVTVLHRLFNPGSDRSAERWIRDYALDGIDALQLQHFYRAMGWLGEKIADSNEKGKKSATIHYVKDVIEEKLFARKKDLFSTMTMAFFDTTSLYFEGEGGETLGQYGHSKDHRPDLPQIVVGVILDEAGNPICSEIVPGNTTDVKSLIPVAARLKERFGIERVCIVADRGMISADTISELEKMNWSYILGVRMRRVKEVSTTVLTNGDAFEEIYPERVTSRDPSPLKVKEVCVDNRRYIVCRNEEEARKDRHDREAIVTSLREQLKQGNKSLVGNKGYRRFLKGADAFTVDEEKIKDEERFDGMWVLRTNTELTPEQVALQYKQLLMVENIFRTMKSVLQTRPIYHQCDETIRGHVFCSFLALVLRKRLQDLMSVRGWEEEWNNVIEDVDSIMNIDVTLNGKKFFIRTEAKGTAGKAFQAVGVALPPVFSEVKVRATTG